MLSAAGPSVGRCVSHAHGGGRRSQFRGEKQEPINAMIKATLCATQAFIDLEFSDFLLHVETLTEFPRKDLQ